MSTTKLYFLLLTMVIYQCERIKAELEAEGVVFKATSDSEVILRLIQKILI